jgi:hypothetical protein
VDSIEYVDLDTDSVDADGEIPQRTVTMLILRGEFDDAIKSYVEDNGCDYLALRIDEDQIERLYQKTSEYMGNARY